MSVFKRILRIPLRRAWRPVAVVPAIVLTMALVGACGSSSDAEEQVRAWVAEGEAAAEEKDHRELLDMISSGYADARGNSRKTIGDLLRIYFLHQSKVALLTKIDELTMHGDTAAEVLMTVGMAGSNHNDALGFSADAYRFALELEHEGDEWLLVSARWGRIGEEPR